MSLFSAFAERTATWYRGKYIPPPANDPNSSFVFHSLGYYEQPFFAKVIGTVWGFYLRHWQWFITTIIGLVAIYVSILALK